MNEDDTFEALKRISYYKLEEKFFAQNFHGLKWQSHRVRKFIESYAGWSMEEFRDEFEQLAEEERLLESRVRHLAIKNC
jgi:hypothetical protein